MSEWTQKSPVEIYADFDKALLSLGRAIHRHFFLETSNGGVHIWIDELPRVDPIDIKRQRRELRQRAKYGTR